MQQAEEHGFEIDLPDNGMLLQPIEHTVTITTPGQWTLVEMIAGEEEQRHKAGRPRKDTHVA